MFRVTLFYILYCEMLATPVCDVADGPISTAVSLSVVGVPVWRNSLPVGSAGPAGMELTLP